MDDIAPLPKPPPSGGSPLDTLEQPDQSGKTGSKTALSKRARAKFFSKALAVELYRHGGPLRRQYGRTLDCSDVIEQHPDGSLTTHYCGYRHCLVCNRIRIAKAINAYAPIIAEWKDAHAVTLTIPNVPGYQLKSAIGQMLAAFTSCKRAIKRTHGLTFTAIRKIEVTYNPARGDFHPHFHVIVDGWAQAEALRTLWLQRWPGTNEAAQDVRPVTEGTLMEVFKYFTRIISKGTERGVDAPSLCIIFEAMQGRRVWQPVGFTKPVADPDDTAALDDLHSATKATKRLTERVLWQWDQEFSDWIDFDSGELLTEYEPGARWAEFVGSVAKPRDVERFTREVRMHRAGIGPPPAD